MMCEMLDWLRTEGFKRASLAFKKANYAVKLYVSVSFAVIDENDEEYIMVCNLQKASWKAEG